MKLEIHIARMCIYGYKNNKSFVLGLENEEVAENIGIDANFHWLFCYSTRIFFTWYQLNQSSSAEPPDIEKYIFEGGAKATIGVPVDSTNFWL